MKYVGNSLPIHDAATKVSGRAVYAADMLLPGMASVAMVFSTVAHGFVTSIDDSEALQMDGVLGVFHCLNTTDKPYNRYRMQPNQGTLDQECLFNRHVRHIGDRVAAVAATSQEIARKAAARIRVTYDPLPVSTTIAESKAGKIDMIFPEGAVFGDFTSEYGDQAQTGSVVTTTHTSLARLTHTAMETHACVADCDGEGRLTIYSPNQSVFGIRTVVADLLEMPYNRVRVVKTTMGGSFGGKQEWVLEPVAAYVATRLRRPVKLVYNRAEVMLSTVTRGPMEATVTSQFAPDGTLKQLHLDVELDAGAYVTNSMDYLRAMCSKLFRTYRYAYAHFSARAVCTNSPVSGAFRGWSAPELCTMIDHNLNQAARKLHMDPLELRLKNVAEKGETDIKLELPLGELHTADCLTLGRERFQYEQKHREDAAFNAMNPRYRRGIGVSCGGHVNTYFPRFPDYGTAYVRMEEDGTVIATMSLHDHGCGTVQAMRMIIAEALEMPFERVSVSEADTAFTPYDYGCYSSRTTYVLGRAAYEASTLLKNLLLDSVAEQRGLAVSDLYVADGCIRSRADDEICVSYGEAAWSMIRVQRREPFARYDYVNNTNPGVTGTHFAHVEVDTYTGVTRLLDYLAYHDIGMPINREMCVAQTQGAVLMGAGAALCEHISLDERGWTLASLKNYHVINAPDAPHIDIAFAEYGNTDGPYGAKSIGEVCHVPVAAAVCGAVNDALGSDIGTLPMTPDVIMQYLKGAERK